MAPTTIGRYEVKSELGRGGMAILYRAFDPRFGRDVAIKVLPHEFLYDETFLARFEQEAKAIATLEHVAIVPVYDFGQHEGQPYLVMRHMPGGSLADRIASDGPVDLDEAVRVTARIGDALDAAHRRGVIHRDVKPGNVLFDADGHAYLTDFGIVKMTESTAQLTGSGIVGTPAYMAPEMARPGGASPLVDVYALGVMLYQMLAGRLPYQADTPIGQMMAHVSDPVPDVREARPDLPPAIQTVLDRALAKEPERRCQSAGEVADRLCAIVPDCVPDRTWPDDAALHATDPYGTTPVGDAAPPSPDPGMTVPEADRTPAPPPSDPGMTVRTSARTPTPPSPPDPGATQLEPAPDDGTMLEDNYAAPPGRGETSRRAAMPSPRQTPPPPARAAPRRQRGVPIWVWLGGAVILGGLVIGVVVLVLSGVLGGPADEPPLPTDPPTIAAADNGEPLAAPNTSDKGADEEPTATPPPTETPVPVPAFRTVSLADVVNGEHEFVDSPVGNLTLGEVPFVIDGQFKSQAAPPPNDTFPTEAVVTMDAPRAFRVHLLITTGDGFHAFAGQPIAEVYAVCGDEYLVSELVLGEHVREWHTQPNVVSEASASVEVWSGPIEGVAHDGYLDMQTFDLPDACVDGTLTAIRVVDVSAETVSSLDPALNLSGVTVEVYE